MPKAKVIEETTINNEPVKVGSVVEVDEITFQNLSRKGRLEAADSSPAQKKAEPAVTNREPAIQSRDPKTATKPSKGK